MKNKEEDLEFAKRTEEAFKRYEKGEFKEVSDEKFLEMLEEIYNPELVEKYIKRKDLWIR